MSEHAETLRDLTTQWFRGVWNDRSNATFNLLMHEDALVFGFVSSLGPAMTKDQVRVWRDQMVGAFPDLEVHLSEIVVEPPMTVVRFEVFGTHLQSLDGLPATGRRFRIAALCMIKWLDGRIIESWNCFDNLGLMRQLGQVE